MSGQQEAASCSNQQLFSLDNECPLAEEDLAAAAPPLLSTGTTETATALVTKTSLHSLGFKSTPASASQCPICGDHITGNHYGVNTCESCKGFFKRTKKAKTQAQLKCVNGSNSCPVMSIEGRKLCAKCRYDKCLAVGMSEGGKSRLVVATTKNAAAVSGSTMMSTRTRTIKRRFIEYDDEQFDAPEPSTAKRVNNSARSSEASEAKQDDRTTIVALDDQSAAKEASVVVVECEHCFRDLQNLNPYNRRTHVDHCKFREKSNCIYCLTPMTELSSDQKREHINECRVEHNNQIHKEAREDKQPPPPSSPSKSKKKTTTAAAKGNDRTESSGDEQEEPAVEKTNESLEESLSLTVPEQASSVNEESPSNKRAPSSRLKAKRSLETAVPVDSPPRAPRPPKEMTSGLGGGGKCRGYKPDVQYSDESTIYSNFPFQAIDFDAENIKFVMENGVFHNHNCAKRDYRLVSDSRDQCNRFCSDLMYNKYLQNIIKRSQAQENFSSVPHIYLTFNQLKKELNHYRENIKKLKLDNLNLKRTIESLRSKEDNYKRFVHLLAQKDYAKLNQIITVCLNQKKGINGIIDKLLDTMEGVYHPREREVSAFQAEDVECKICAEKVPLFKMRDHVAAHLRNQDVPDDASRCGFCGLAQTCSIDIKVNKCKGDKGEAFWPVSDCAYFKNFNLRMSNKPTKGLLASNRPIECHICKKVIWSFNVRAHFNESHLDAEPPELLTDDEGVASRNVEEVNCKICNEPVGLAKMRDHVTKHLLFKEVSENENTCGFCGLVGCSIEIRVTSGKGKNTTYGPHSDCAYFRKFNLKSSTRPTKSSPSTNRPIECHLCKNVFWSYNVKCHFVRQHPEESAPELITDLEREMVARS